MNSIAFIQELAQQPWAGPIAGAVLVVSVLGIGLTIGWMLRNKQTERRHRIFRRILENTPALF